MAAAIAEARAFYPKHVAGNVTYIHNEGPFRSCCPDQISSVIDRVHLQVIAGSLNAILARTEGDPLVGLLR